MKDAPTKKRGRLVKMLNGVRIGPLKLNQGFSARKPKNKISTCNPINHSTNQPINHSTNQPTNLSTIQPFNLSTIQPPNHPYPFLNTTTPSNTSTITGTVLSISPPKIFLLSAFTTCFCMSLFSGRAPNWGS